VNMRWKEKEEKEGERERGSEASRATNHFAANSSTGANPKRGESSGVMLMNSAPARLRSRVAEPEAEAPKIIESKARLRCLHNKRGECIAARRVDNVRLAAARPRAHSAPTARVCLIERLRIGAFAEEDYRYVAVRKGPRR
jgi:hypothetical protein